MPTCLYLRGCPGSGKHTVARILERDLGWPRLWVHHFDAVYRAIGEYRVPELTDELMEVTTRHLMNKKRSLIVVRPTRCVDTLHVVNTAAEFRGYTFVPVQLTASYETLVTRVRRRECGNESPFRLTTKEALDEYLNARPAELFPGEHVIDTDALSPEEVAAKVRGLLP